MKMNVGGVDRGVRIAAGLAVLSIVFVLDSATRWWGLFGLVPLLTGLAGWCPLYPMLGLSTCPARAR